MRTAPSSAPGIRVRQATQTFKNLRTVLQFHGADFPNLLKVTVYVTSFDWFDGLSALRERLFAGSPLASAIVQVARLVQPELLIEVEARPRCPALSTGPRPRGRRRVCDRWCCPSARRMRGDDDRRAG